MSALSDVADAIRAVIGRLDDARTGLTAAADSLGDIIDRSVGAIGKIEQASAARDQALSLVTTLTAIRDQAAEVLRRVQAMMGDRPGSPVASVPAGSTSSAAAAPPLPTSGQREWYEVLGSRVDGVLVKGGIDPSDVHMRARPDTPERIMLARSLLDNPFSKRIRDRMLPWALQFAAEQEGPRDPAMLARRYEYAKAVYDAEKREVWFAVNQGTIRLQPGQSIDSIAADRATGHDFRDCSRLAHRPPDGWRGSQLW